MKHDLTTGTWQADTGCPISIVLAATSDVAANNYQPGDSNRSEIDPDLLVKGVKDIIMDAEARERLYDFIAWYVRKVCPDSIITKGLRAMPGYTLLDLIRPSDIAYVISLLKNGRGMWDMEIEMREMARSGEIKQMQRHGHYSLEVRAKKRKWGRTCQQRKVLSIIILGRRIGEKYTRIRHSLGCHTVDGNDG